MHWGLLIALSVIIGTVLSQTMWTRVESTAFELGQIVGFALGSIGLTAVIAFIPGFIYRFWKKRPLPRFNILVWGVWIVVTVFFVWIDYRLQSSIQGLGHP